VSIRTGACSSEREFDLLLEEDGSEAGVESTNTFRLEHLAEAADETAGICRLRDETDAGGLERAEGDISEELGGGRRGEVDACPVVGGILVAELVDELLLKELVATELEGTLEEVAGEGRADTSEKRAGALALDDLPETADHAIVVRDGVELDTCLDATSRLLATLSQTLKSRHG